MEKRRRRVREELQGHGWRVWFHSPPWRRTRSCAVSSEEAGWEKMGEDKEMVAGDLQAQPEPSCLL